MDKGESGAERGNVMDAVLENRIEKAGREKVFAVVRSAGWIPGQEVPIHVWDAAIYIVSVSQETMRGRGVSG